MGLDCTLVDLADLAGRLRAEGVKRIVWADDGTADALEFFPLGDDERRDTEAAPPPSMRIVVSARTEIPPPPRTPREWQDPHPELFPPAETTVQAVARELESLRGTDAAGCFDGGAPPPDGSGVRLVVDADDACATHEWPAFAEMLCR